MTVSDTISLFARRESYPMRFILFVLWPLLLICFVATPNPYSALHSGAAGSEAEQVSGTLIVNQALLFGSAIAFIWFVKTRFIRMPVVLCLGFVAMLLSGVWTGVLFDRPQTYAYDIGVFMLLSTLAGSRLDQSGNAKSLYIWSAFLFLLGIAAAFIQPDRWGAPYFEFDRFDRGELTLAGYLGCYFLFPQLSFVAKRIPRWFRLTAWALISALNVATFTRTVAYLCLAPAFVYALTRISSKIILSCVLIAIVSTVCYVISEIELDYDTTNLLLTGRLDLWDFYLEAFLKNPILGSGAYLLERDMTYMSGAVSEIGVLKSFAEFGLLWGAVQLWIVVVACIRSVSCLRANDCSEMTKYCALVVLTATPLFLLTGMTRILSVNDCIFWYCVLSLYMQAKVTPTMYLGMPRTAP